MKSFNTYHDDINEALVTFGGKAYPRDGHAVILAGGAGSGKGFVLSKLIGIEGKIFDVDELKKAMLKQDKFKNDFIEEMKKLVKVGKMKKVLAVDDPNLMKEPAVVSALHAVAKKHGIPAKVIENFFTGSAGSKVKPNVIFDVTMKDVTKLHNLSAQLIRNGYEKKNIHMVWIVNDVEVAMSQNLKRARVVPADIFLDTHEGAARTMADLINDGKSISKYMDGDFWIVPNKMGVSGKWVPGKNKGAGAFLVADTFKIKAQGKPMNLDIMTDKLTKKIQPLLKTIKDFVPKGTFTLNKDKK